MILHNSQPESHWYTETLIFLIGWPQGHCFRLWFVGLVSRLWVELRLAPHVSFLRHSFTVVQEHKRKSANIGSLLDLSWERARCRFCSSFHWPNQIMWPSPNISGMGEKYSTHSGRCCTATWKGRGVKDWEHLSCPVLIVYAWGTWLQYTGLECHGKGFQEAKEALKSPGW